MDAAELIRQEQRFALICMVLFLAVIWVGMRLLKDKARFLVYLREAQGRILCTRSNSDKPSK